MFEDRIILFEDMNLNEAVKLIKMLPMNTPKEDRHKFVFTINKQLIIGRADIGNPSHSDLGDTKSDKIAGYICFTIDKNKVTYVYINNQSKDFTYPKFEYLKDPQIFITKIFGPVSVDMEDIPKPKSKIIDLSSLTTH